MKNFKTTLISATFFLTLSGNSFAQDSLKDLQSRLSKLEKEIKTLSEQKEQKKDYNNEKSVITTALQDAHLYGRLHVDAKWSGENGNNDSKKDGVDIRRARLAIDGTMGKDLYYKFDNDFTANKSRIFDAYVAYRGIKEVEFRFGNFRPAFALEMLNSSNSMVFTERSVATNRSPDRHVGFEVAKFNEKWQAAAGFFGEGTGHESRTDDTSYLFSTRATYAFVNTDKALLHFGLAGNYSSQNRNTVQTNSTTTTADAIDKNYFLGTEFMARINSIEFQGEYMFEHIDYDKDAVGSSAPSTTGLKASFNSYYIQVSNILTGEHRPYKTKTGVVSNFKVNSPVDKGGKGAWEIAARFAVANRNDNYRTGLINQGDTKEYTLATNWYLNDNFRMMVDYLISQTDVRASANQKSNTFTIRTQFMF